MAPLALENITEDISRSQQEDTNPKECMSKVYAAATGSFCIGFSGGIATQVHYARFIPRTMRALLVIPTVFGFLSSTAVYKHQSKRCLQMWEVTSADRPFTQAQQVNGIPFSN